MLYTVEVRLIGADLPGFMSRVREWLDHRHYEPDGFRYSRGTPVTTCRLEFKLETEAVDFAKSFGGRILGSVEHVYPAPATLSDRPAGADIA